MGRGGLIKSQRRRCFATWMAVFLLFSYFVATVTYGSPINFILSIIYLRTDNSGELRRAGGRWFCCYALVCLQGRRGGPASFRAAGASLD